ncbi:MAG: PKD domain-containing protein, partial [Bacteroidales bacterium]|nr:PKD domain-containing protein [Bacteroidales bacterium]
DDVTLTLTVYSPCGDVTDDAILTVHPNPTANFLGVPETIHVENSVIFTDDSSDDVTDWVWTFVSGNPGTSNAQNPPEILYSNTGQYNVKLVVKNKSGCSDELEKQDYILVIPQPDADFSVSEEYLTPGGSTQFHHNSINFIETWAWTFEGGDPDTSNDQNPTITYNAIGDYDVSLTITDILGADTEENKVDFIHVGNKPEADFSVDTNMTSTEDTIQFTDNSILYSDYQHSWEWDFGDENSSTLRNPSHKYSDVGEYSISLVVINDFGSDSIIKENLITIGEKPADNFSPGPQKIFIGDTVQFNNIPTSPNTIWEWTFEGGQPYTSNDQSPKVLYSSEGVYSVELFVSNPFGFFDIIKEDIISVYKPIEIDILSDPNKVCTGDAITFNANIDGGSGEYNYQWKYYSDSIIIYTSTNSSFSNLETQDYSDSLRLEITDNELSYKIFEKTYRNFAKPLPPKPNIVSKPEMISDTMLPTLLICTDSGYIYQWYKDNDTIVGATLQFYYPQNYDSVFSHGDYSVKIKHQITGCLSEKSNTIKIPEIQKDLKHIKVYPNPNNGSFVIQMPNGIFVNNKGVIARIWSFDGKLISNFLVNNQNSTNEIITNIPYIKGIYFIEVISNNGEHYNTKFIID